MCRIGAAEMEDSVRLPVNDNSPGRTSPPGRRSVIPGHSCNSKTGRRASGMTVNCLLRSSRAASIAVVPPSRMTVSPSAKRLAAAAPIVALASGELEGPDGVRGLLGTEEGPRRPAVDTSKGPDALQRLKITAHCHLRALQFAGQLSDQHWTALAERLENHLVA